jgi:peptidoglycan/LPS O-acetylase OafA/YrhL
MSYGHAGVPLFFVISGFCIHQRWARQRAEGGAARVDFVGFWRRRLWRLYPSYLTALCLSMLLVLAAYAAGSDRPILTRYPEPRAWWIGADFLAHLGMLHGLHPVFDKGGGNAVFWSLAREEYLYLMYFVILAGRRRVGIKSCLLGVTLIGLAFPFVMRLALRPDSDWWGIVNTSALVLWVQWCLGAVAVEGYYGLVGLPRWAACGWAVPLLATLAICAESRAAALGPLLWGLTFFVLVNACVERERRGGWSGRLPVRWLAAVGVFSYSLYLVNLPVQNLIKQVFPPRLYAGTQWLYLGYFFVLVLASVGAGKGFYHIIERHFFQQRPVHVCADFARRESSAVPRPVN